MLRLALLLLTLICPPTLADEPLRLAVSANFRATLEHINGEYSQRTGQQFLLSSASTGVLANQVVHGAPFDLYFAADDRTPAKLLADGLGQSARCYAMGSLALVGGDLDALATPGQSLAIGNPVTAPYGRAAMDVLARPEYDTQRTLVRGTNVLQAYQFWRTGAADLALVARSLAPDGAVVPSHWHQPLAQHLLVINDSPQVSAYLQWLGSDTVRDMINNAGYLPCP